MTDEIGAKALTDLAEAWLAQRHPDAVIVRELSVADWGGASVDIAAITDRHIVGVEVKGAGDSPARLDRQGLAYGMVCRELWLLPCPSIARKCYARIPSGWGRLEVFDGRARPYNLHRVQDGWEERQSGNLKWEAARMIRSEKKYHPHNARIGGHLTPLAMCGTLWRDELFAICSRRNIQVPNRATVGTLTQSIISTLPAPDIHAEMIRELRSRKWRKRVRDLRLESIPAPDPEQGANLIAGLDL